MMLDLFILIILVLSALIGFRRGIIVAFFNVIWTIILFVSIPLIFPILRDWLNNSLSLSSSITLFIVLLFAYLFASLIWGIFISTLLHRIPQSIQDGLVNHLLGIIPGLAASFLYLALIAWFITRYPIPEINQYVGQSRIVPVLSQISGPYLAPLSNPVETLLESLSVETQNTGLEPDFKTLPVSSDNLTVDVRSEDELFRLLNLERTNRGLPPLTVSKDLQNVARRLAEDMWRKQYFSHIDSKGLSPFDRLKQAHIFYFNAGENLAFAQSAQSANTGLINSPKHRENILFKEFGRVGIGAINGGPGVGIIFVQEFTN